MMKTWQVNDLISNSILKHNLLYIKNFTFEFLTSSIVSGTSVRFLPMQATVSLVLSQLHTLGHFPASTCKLSAKISRTAAEKNWYICTSKTWQKNMNIHLQSPWKCVENWTNSRQQLLKLFNLLREYFILHKLLVLSFFTIDYLHLSIFNLH